MKRTTVCLCGGIISALFMIFWIIVFVSFRFWDESIQNFSKTIAYINIGFVIILLLVFGLCYNLTLDMLINDQIKTNQKLDRIIYGAITLLFVAVLFFEILFAIYCNVKSIYLSSNETVRYLNIPWLILGNSVAAFVCYVVYQFYHHFSM